MTIRIVIVHINQPNADVTEMWIRIYTFCSRKKLIAEADPYDGAKSVMAPCKKEGYIPGEITGTKGDFVTVKLKGGEVKEWFIK